MSHFEKERLGKYKGDICQVAALYAKGGYYFDVDIRVIKPVELAFNVTFATSLDAPKTGFFQAFLASSPGHAVLREALKNMIAYYERTRHFSGWMGVQTLKDAFDTLPSSARGAIRILEEINLEGTKLYPEIPRQPGAGACNYVVQDASEEVVYFFSRVPFPGSITSYCTV